MLGKSIYSLKGIGKGFRQSVQMNQWRKGKNSVEKKATLALSRSYASQYIFLQKPKVEALQALV